MKIKRIISSLLIIVMIFAMVPATALAADYTEWSTWSTSEPLKQDGREIQTRDVVVGYNMELYLTMTQGGIREYRSYSVGGNYSAYGLRPAYGEFHYTYYATKDSIDSSDTAAEGAYVNYANNTAGYNRGRGTAYVGWNVQDCLVWFIGSEVTQREYRYRDVISDPSPGSKTYMVTFVNWDGTELKTEIVEEGKSATPPSDPYRDGYVFTGWSTAYSNVRQNLTITAQYQKVQETTFLVFFDAGDGVPSFGSKEVNYGETFGTLPTATLEGYTFDGWFTALNGGTQITSSTIVNITQNITLHAHWTKDTPKSYTAYFNANGGSCPLASKTVLPGEVYGDLPTPTRDSYTFTGWYTATSGGSRVTNSTTVSVSSNHTLYAQWEMQSSGVSVADLTYRFSNSYSAFGYVKGYKIPLERYQLIFGDTTFARIKYLNSDEWGGSCYGAATTASMFYVDNDILVSAFRAGASYISQLGVADRNSSWNLSLRDYIEAMQISWYSSLVSQAYWNNIGNLSGMVSAVQAFQASGRDPIVICVYGAEGGHALVGYDLESVSSGESRLYVYDCNFPNNPNRYITLYKNSAGQYTGWYYHLNDIYNWGSNYANGKLTYIPYSVFYSVWSNRAGNNSNMVYMTLNVADATVYDAEHNPVATIKDGVLVAGRNNVYPIADIGITADGTSNTTSGFSAWLSTDLYIIENEDTNTEILEVTMANVEQAATVTTSASSITLAVDDSQELNFAQIDETGCSYEITLISSLADTYADVQLSGTTLDKVLSLSQISGTIQASGTSETGKLIIDGKEVSLQSVEQDTGSIGGIPQVSSKSFSDVLPGAYYYEPVMWAVARGITNGTSETTFNPNASCTRAQLLTMLWRAAGCPEPKSSSTKYTDIEKGTFYYNAVLWAVENGIATGESATSFNPVEVIDRAEFVTYLYRFAGKPDVQGYSKFEDVPISASYAAAVAWAVKNGVTTGTTATTFTPSGLCTRAQAMTFLFRHFTQNS